MPIERIARVLQASEAQLHQAAGQLGLDPARQADTTWINRGYLTIIRQNWHLCTYDQILTMLDMTEEQLGVYARITDSLVR